MLFLTRQASSPAALIVCALVGVSDAQEPQPAFEPYVGEVTGDAVNVRSGPSTNHYEVAKLDAGARVRVVGREFNWLAIDPPEDVFSLVAAADVDLGEDGTAVVRVEKANVYAEPIKPKKKADDHHSHPKLSRGAVVKSFGSREDGFLRIAPPVGAKVWISGDYVQMVPVETLAREAQPLLPKAITDLEAGRMPASWPASPATQPADVQSGTGGGPVGESVSKLRAKLEEVDSLLEQQMSLPLEDRNLEPVRALYQPLADQKADEYVRLYAGKRLEQIDSVRDVYQAVRQLREVGERMRVERKEAVARRMHIQPVPQSVDQGFVVEGELRSSAIYDSPTGPQRFRLVDPKAEIPRTIAYIEFAEGVSYDMTDYLGRRVGVRAHQRIIQEGGSEAVPVYRAEELVLLEGTTEGAPPQPSLGNRPNPVEP